MADKYVSAGGSNGAAGTLGAPYATILYGWGQIVAGETLWVMSDLTVTVFSSTSEGMILTGNGTAGNTKKLCGYPAGTKRTVDLAAFTFDTWGGTGVRITSNYAEIRDIHFTNMQAPARTSPYIDGLNLRGTNGLLFNCEVSDVEGRGITIGENATSATWVIDSCDIHDCVSPEDYADADGIQCYTVSAGNIIRKCRIWRCSDDGIDLFFVTGAYTIEDNWIWAVGYREDGTTTGGDGNGIKAGQDSVAGGTHLLQRNLLFDNRQAAIVTNGNTSVCDIRRNTSINCPTGFRHYSAAATVFRSNAQRTGTRSMTGGTVVQRNSWDTPPGLTETDAWFESLSRTGVDGSRGTDGALPVLAFAKLASGSALLGAGQSSENIGAFDEYVPEGTAVDFAPASVQAATNLKDTSTNNPPSVMADVTDDPDSPNASWWTAVSATANTSARVRFPTPGSDPVGAQSFKLWLRKTAGAPNPTVTISLYQNGSLIAALVSNVSITSTTGQLVEAPWTAAQLTTASGANVEVLISGNAA